MIVCYRYSDSPRDVQAQLSLVKVGFPLDCIMNCIFSHGHFMNSMKNMRIIMIKSQNLLSGRTFSHNPGDLY